MSNSIIFNGVSSKSFNMFVSGGGTFDVAERDYSKIEISGRNGDLIIDNGRYRNIQIVYKAFIPDHFQKYIPMVRAWLASTAPNYCILEDDYDKLCYRKARFIDALNISTKYKNYSADIELKFDCKPQRFLKIGDIKKIIDTSGTIIVNPTIFESKPLIVAHGNGNAGTITIGGKTISINSWIPGGSTTTMYIDSELMDAYNGANNCNGCIAGEFPVFNGGENTVSFTGGISSLEIVPRWWML